MEASCKGIAASVLPGFLMLGLFYSLANHMRLSLGAWPDSIGENGFSRGLLAHVQMTILYFEILILATIFGLPIAILASLLTPGSRRAVPYLALSGITLFVCWGLMQLAPKPFLYWWRD